MSIKIANTIEIKPFTLQQEFFGAGPGCGTLLQVKLCHQLGQLTLFVISEITNRTNCPN
jgi:hypothetical protein